LKTAEWYRESLRFSSEDAAAFIGITRKQLAEHELFRAARGEVAPSIAR
jgi:DNA-binding XRE family transcriptional regulator